MTAEYFFWFGTLMLAIMTYEDIFRNRTIDTRRNYIMVGMALSLLSHFWHNLFYIFAVIVAAFCTVWLLGRAKTALGNMWGLADTGAFMWLIVGLGYISASTLMWFYVILVLAGTIYLGGAWLGKKEYVPFFPVILLSFVCTGIMLGLY